MAANTTRKKIQAGAALFVVAAIIIVGALAAHPKSPATAMQTTAMDASTGTKSSASTASCATVSDATMFKDGTYNAIGSYSSPGGTEKIKVSLTLGANVVNAANVTSDANDPTAATYQSYFVSSYKTSVVGKKISTIKLTNISGSSLTSMGFSNALKTIECQAEQQA